MQSFNYSVLETLAYLQVDSVEYFHKCAPPFFLPERKQKLYYNHTHHFANAE